MTDRTIIYPGAIPLETDLLSAEVAAMVAIGYALGAVLGESPIVSGLACAPTSPASLSVTVARGAITQLSVVDGSAFSSVLASSDPLLKIGVNRTPTTLTFVAPTSPGQSQAFLIQAQFSETDTGSVVLPYYNAANPLVSFAGPNNSGTAQYTQRIQRALIQVKNGVPASTGSQAAPTVDAGWVPLYVVTLANGATTVLSGNIVLHPSAPFVDPAQTGRGIQPGRLLNRRAFSSSAIYAPTPGTNSIFAQIVGGGASGGGTANTGASQVSASVGGSAGGYAEKWITSGFAGAAITIGAGGATAGPNSAGNPGGTTSLGAILSATGGGVSPVGPAAVANNQPQGAAQGGVGIGGDVNGRGGSPIYAVYTNPATGSEGGRSYFGDGGLGITGAGNGSPGVTPGSGGGGGAQSVASSAGAYGGAGAPGLVVIWEFS